MASTIVDVNRKVARTYVCGWLQAVRLPLTAAERLAGKQGDESWAPTVAFERLAAEVKRSVGGFTGDEALVEEARLTNAKLDQLREAAELRTSAEAKRAQAEAEQQEAERRQAEQAQRAEQELQAKERQAEQREREEKARVEQEAREAKAEAAEAEKVVERAVAKGDRKAKRAALEAEEQALQTRQQAEEAVADVLELDRSIETNRAARRAAR